MSLGNLGHQFLNIGLNKTLWGQIFKHLTDDGEFPQQENSIGPIPPNEEGLRPSFDLLDVAPTIVSGAKLATKGMKSSPFRRLITEATPGLNEHDSRLKNAASMGFDTGKKWYHGTLADLKEFSPGIQGAASGGHREETAFFFTNSPKTASSYADMPLVSGRIHLMEKILNRQMEEKQDALRNALKHAKTPEEVKQIKAELEDLFQYSRKEQSLLDAKRREINNHYAQEFIEKTPSKKYSEIDYNEYSKKAKTYGGNVIPTHLKMENPYSYDMKGREYHRDIFSNVIKNAKEAGHDSVLFKNVNDTLNVSDRDISDVAAVFKPNQIRSIFAKFNPAHKESSDISAMFGGLLGGAGAAAMMPRWKLLEKREF